MWLIQPVDDDKVDPSLQEYYQKDLQQDGYISNTTRAWSHRPEMFSLWFQLIKTVRGHLRLRTYELVTVAAARAMGCVY